MRPHPPRFGDLLRHHRRALPLSQEALAERAGVSTRAISDLERGARQHPYRETATLLADALALGGSARSAFLAAARRPLPSIGVATHTDRDTHLPRPLASLIGREVEQHEIVSLLRDDRCRLLTLAGTAGVGKSRLAVAVAAEVGDAFRDGVVYVDMAPVTEPSQVVAALAAALGLVDQGAIPLVEAVRRRLSPRQLLMVLDNFEHLLPAAPVLSDLLQTAPDVQALVTSRAVLRLRGEREYPLAPLRTPDPGTMPRLEDLGDWGAIHLFVDRACAVQSGFRLTLENASDVVAICQRLDGLPLAIELAATRARLLTPSSLLARLERRLPLLTAGLRDAPARQRTLRAAIAWSYDLLDSQEQALFRCLAVFAGGWTLEAAEAVGAGNGVRDVFAALAALVEQSLVVRDDAAPVSRYRFLETIREYALDQLLAAGEEECVRRSHLQYLLRLARENDLERLDAGVGTRLARLQAEEGNLRAGIAWALEHDPESAAAVLAELDFFWFLSDRLLEGRNLHERVLGAGAAVTRPERARILQQAAWLADYAGDFAQAEPLADAAHALADQLGDRRTVAHARLSQAGVAVSRGAVVQATAAFDEALTQFEALGDPWGVVMCLTGRGVAALGWGEAQAAAACFEQVGAIVVAHELPSHYHAHYLGNLAAAYGSLGRHEAAMEACLAAMRYGNDAARGSTLAMSRLAFARLLLDHGEIEQAIARGAEIAESLQNLWEVGDRWNLVEALEVAASVMAAGDQAAPAARLLGAAAALREAMPYPVGVGERARMDGLVSEIAAALGESPFRRAWTFGRARPLGDLVTEAQGLLATRAR